MDEQQSGLEETKLRGTRSTGFVLRVVAPGTLLSFPFPSQGEVSIGRAVEANIRVPLPDMSRKHAVLRWADKIVEVSDAGSSNGTVVRGDRLKTGEWKPIAFGEPFFIADAALIVHEGTVTDGPRRLVGREAFERALNEQITSYQRTHAPFGVCMIDVDAEAPWSDFVVALLSRGDVAGFLSDSCMRLILANRTPEQLGVLEWFLQQSLTQFTSRRHVGVRACPRDGVSFRALYGEVPQREPAREVSVHETRRPSSAPIVRSAAMQRVHSLISDVARTRTSILLLGETGVGKDVLARTIHSHSDRAAAPFVGLNCAALPESLLESELFGYERGAFTGAVAAKLGLIEAANGGTIFLDEVGEMPLSTQAKLLRVLEERRVMRVGGLKAKSVDFRLIAATNRNLQTEIAASRFRADLFYRINGLSITIPPLRERREEIMPLAEAFAQRAAASLGKGVPIFSPDAQVALESYSWPGNIRELRSVVERAVLLVRGLGILPDHFPDEVTKTDAPPLSMGEPPVTSTALPTLGGGDDEDEEEIPRSVPHARVSNPNLPAASPNSSSASSLRDEMDRLEYQRIVEALQEYGGNQTRAAQALGISRRALIIRLERYGLPRPRKAKE